MSKDSSQSIQDKEAIDTTPDSVIEENTPDSLAEATTASLPDDALGGHATQDDIKEDKN